MRTQAPSLVTRTRPRAFCPSCPTLCRRAAALHLCEARLQPRQRDSSARQQEHDPRENTQLPRQATAPAKPSCSPAGCRPGTEIPGALRLHARCSFLRWALLYVTPVVPNRATALATGHPTTSEKLLIVRTDGELPVREAGGRGCCSARHDTPGPCRPSGQTPAGTASQLCWLTAWPGAFYRDGTAILPATLPLARLVSTRDARGEAHRGTRALTRARTC